MTKTTTNPVHTNPRASQRPSREPVAAFEPGLHDPEPDEPETLRR